MDETIPVTQDEFNAIKAYRAEIYNRAENDPGVIDWEEMHFGHVCFGFLVAKGIPVERADELASICRYRMGIA